MRIGGVLREGIGWGGGRANYVFVFGDGIIMQTHVQCTSVYMTILSEHLIACAFDIFTCA